MITSINLCLVQYTLKHIKRYGTKNFFIASILTLLVALLASTFFIANAMKQEYMSLLDSQADIILTKQKAYREIPIDESSIDTVLKINGVSAANTRVWGKYYFAKADVFFTIYGVDEFETYKNPLFEKLSKESLAENEMLVSQGVSNTLEMYYYKDYFNFISTDGKFQKINIKSVFDGGTIVEQKSLIVMSKESTKKLFSYKENEASDLSVKVVNKDEVPQVALKLTELFPGYKLEMKNDLKVTYERLYDFRSGFFLTIFIIVFFTFFMIIYDKMSGLSSEQKQEIGILKAIGWRVEDVLNAKLYEGLIISIVSYMVGIILAFIYVFLLNAPYLKKIFLNNYDLLGDYTIHFNVDYQTLVLIFFLSVPLYIAATIIPAWRVAVSDADEVMR